MTKSKIEYRVEFVNNLTDAHAKRIAEFMNDTAAKMFRNMFSNEIETGREKNIIHPAAPRAAPTAAPVHRPWR